METATKSKLFVQLIAGVLATLAVSFAHMACLGKIYEPQMPEQLKKEI